MQQPLSAVVVVMVVIVMAGIKSGSAVVVLARDALTWQAPPLTSSVASVLCVALLLVYTRRAKKVTVTQDH